MEMGKLGLGMGMGWGNGMKGERNVHQPNHPV